MDNYKKWLTATAQYYGIPENKIIGKGKGNASISSARSTFYYLCFRDGINLYRLSEMLGKDRSGVIKSCYNTKYRNVEVEKEIKACVEANTIDNVIDHWLVRQESKVKEIVLTSLIAQKQHFYENE